MEDGIICPCCSVRIYGDNEGIFCLKCQKMWCDHEECSSDNLATFIATTAKYPNLIPCTPTEITALSKYFYEGEPLYKNKTDNLSYCDVGDEPGEHNLEDCCQYIWKCNECNEIFTTEPG